MSVIVTGAAGHLGTAICDELAGAGVDLVLADRDAAAVEDLAHRLGGQHIAIAGDLTDPALNRAVADRAVEAFGSIDGCVAAAGIEGPVAPVEDLDLEAVASVFRVNVLAIFALAAAVVPHMKLRRSGRFVPMASGAGLAGGALGSAYHASKHAVVGLTRSMARELAPFGIAVNAVCPGYIESPMVQRILDSETALTGIESDPISAIPAGRMGTATEVAAAVRYLVLDAPGYVNGTCLVLDGGLRA